MPIHFFKYASNVSEAKNKVVKALNKSEQCAAVEKVTEKNKDEESNQKYKCAECEIDCKSKEKFEEHLIDEHDDDTEVHLHCKNCSERMMTRTDLLSHIELEYLGPDLSYTDGRVKCKMCGKDFIQRSQGILHALSGRGNKKRNPTSRHMTITRFNKLL